MEEEARAFVQWQRLSELEEKFMHQRSKLHWLKVGNENNRYIHQAVKVWEARNYIREFQRGDGTLAVTQEEIKVEAERFFKKIISDRSVELLGITKEALRDLLNFECSEVDVERLSAIVTEEEVKDVLFAIPSNKPP